MNGKRNSEGVSVQLPHCCERVLVARVSGYSFTEVIDLFMYVL